jgi:hypothetical protein
MLMLIAMMMFKWWDSNYGENYDKNNNNSE